MKKISTLALTAVLLCGLAVPVFAAGNNDAGVMNGTMDRTPAANNFDRATAPMRNGFGMRDTNRVDGYRANNTMRANAATNDDGVDWGWLGLAGLIGLAGLRGRERSK